MVAKSCNGKTTNVQRISPKNSSEMITNEDNKEMPKERYISSEERQKSVDDVRLIQ